MWYHGSGAGDGGVVYLVVIRKQREGVRGKNTSKITVVVTPVTPAPGRLRQERSERRDTRTIHGETLH